MNKAFPSIPIETILLADFGMIFVNMIAKKLAFRRAYSKMIEFSSSDELKEADKRLIRNYGHPDEINATMGYFRDEHKWKKLKKYINVESKYSLV